MIRIIYMSKSLSVYTWLKLRSHLYRIAFRSDVKKHLSVPFRNAIFGGIIATERCCFAQHLKIVHSVSDRCFFVRKSISGI
jgi:hypothetical protein